MREVPTVFDVACKEHPTEGCTVQIDRNRGEVFVECRVCHNALYAARMRPRGCDCLTPSQRRKP